MVNELQKKELLNILLPHLNKLLNNIPKYGEICLKVKICDFKAGTINLGVEISNRVQKK